MKQYTNKNKILRSRYDMSLNYFYTTIDINSEENHRQISYFIYIVFSTSLLYVVNENIFIA